MNGEAPVAIPTTFENTKFPSVAKKIKNLVTSREEALAAHELARSHMAERIKSNIQERTNGLVGLETSENKLSQKDGSKMRGTIRD
jgi:hypothetical protein